MFNSSSASDTPDPTHVVVSKGQVMSIVTCILIITSLIAVFARFSVKWTTSKRLHVDDGLIFIALVSFHSSLKLSA